MAWFAGSTKYPQRMNLTDVEIRTLQRSHGTNQEILDTDFQEPTGPYARRGSIALKAQVVFERHERNMTLFGGDTKPVIGRLVFRTKDLHDELATYGLDKLNNGDLITKLENITVEYLIVEVRPTAWLRTNGKATPQTMTAYFSHNDEQRQGARGAR